ncbi:MAG: TolC family protein [Deferribacteres bacterium]|nr:TolC family protein [candidate division KSB1 bacterium]MCB9503164.1 TolC family protein [Deferribacteres bacterium]
MTNKPLVISCALAMVFLTGCSVAHKATRPMPTPSIVKEHVTKEEKTKSKNSAVTDTLLMLDAISQALKSNPELQVFLTEIKAREVRTLQESLLPNPELDFELENFAGSGPLGGFKSSETTLAIGQLLELGGKRAKRTKVAALQSDLALWRYEIKRLQIITRVRSNFTHLLLAQRKLDLGRRLVGLSQIFKANIDTLVQAGRLSRAESARAQVELSNRKLTLQKNARELKNAQRKLAATWGSGRVDFTAVKGDLGSIKTMPKAEIVQWSLENSPVIIEQKAVIKMQKAKTELANALAVPDLGIRVGYRRFNEIDDQALVAGLSIPLTVFDRNQGGKQEAQLRELQSEQHLFSLQNGIRTGINNQLETIRTISEEIETMKNIIIPEAQNAYDIIQQNYRLGKYALIDVLDAQRQLFDVQGRYLDALGEIKLEIIRLEGLLGQSLDSL